METSIETLDPCPRCFRSYSKLLGRCRLQENVIFNICFPWIIPVKKSEATGGEEEEGGGVVISDCVP
jgi:hypothetical protein